MYPTGTTPPYASPSEGTSQRLRSAYDQVHEILVLHGQYQEYQSAPQSPQTAKAMATLLSRLLDIGTDLLNPIQIQAQRLFREIVLDLKTRQWVAPLFTTNNEGFLVFSHLFNSHAGEFSEDKFAEEVAFTLLELGPVYLQMRTPVKTYRYTILQLSESKDDSDSEDSDCLEDNALIIRLRSHAHAANLLDLAALLTTSFHKENKQKAAQVAVFFGKFLILLHEEKGEDAVNLLLTEMNKPDDNFLLAINGMRTLLKTLLRMDMAAKSPYVMNEKTLAFVSKKLMVGYASQKTALANTFFNAHYFGIEWELYAKHFPEVQAIAQPTLGYEFANADEVIEPEPEIIQLIPGYAPHWYQRPVEMQQTAFLRDQPSTRSTASPSPSR